MEGVMETGGHGAAPGMRAGSASAAQLPLAMVGEGDEATVLRVRGSQEFCQHMAELGFVAGARVGVVSRAGGDVVVRVKGSTLGIDRSTAMRVVTG